jgi:hypothetical protein
MSRYAFWIAICIFLALVASKFSPQTGFTSLIRFGETWEAKRNPSLRELPIATVPHSNGYDGQFYAQLALDPLLLSSETSAALDVPAYRARRILTPAMASVAGAGNPWWTLQIFALLNVGCWLVLAWVVYRNINVSDWVSFARWVGCMFGMGVLESVRQSLVDLPALLLLALAILAHDRARSARSTCWLALAGLAKESSVLGAIALVVESFRWPFTTKRKALSLAVAAMPLVAWSFYIYYRLPHSAGTSGAGNFTWPLVGMVLQIKTSLSEIARGNWDGRYSMGLMAVLGLITQAWTIWRRPNITSSWWRIGAAYALLLLVLSPWVWSGYWAVCRALLPMTIAFNLLLPGNSRAFWPLWVLGNSTMLHAIWRFL